MFNNLFLKLVSGASIICFVIFIGACNNGNITSPTPSATETTHHGIMISTLVDSPWPDVPVYKYPGEGNIIKIGDEISMGFDVNSRLGQYWKASFDEDYLILQDNKVVDLDPLSPGIGTTWFRFNAIKEGNTSINYELISVGNNTLMSFTFIFLIVE